MPVTLYDVMWIIELILVPLIDIGVHAVCDGGGRSLVGGTGTHVLQR